MNQQVKHWLFSQATTEAFVERLAALESTPVVADSVETITQRIYAQVQRNPQGIAVVDEQGELTYAALWQGALLVADQLGQCGIEQESLVAVKLSRQGFSVLAMLGVWLAGAAYVPIDPAAPEARQQLILEDAGCAVLLVDDTTSASVSGENVLNLEELLASDSAVDALDSSVYGLPKASADKLAYVIYTSGSTGIPKGVLVEHQHFCQLLDACLAVFDCRPTDVWSCFHSFSFDFSVWELWAPLCLGAQTVVIPYEVSRDSAAFYQWLLRYQVSVVSQTPSAFYALIDTEQHHAPALHCIRYVVFGGEALSVERLQPWVERYPLAEQALVNMYGITETTVHATYKQLTAADLQPSSSSGSPIGQALAHLSFTLIDLDSEALTLATEQEDGSMVGELLVAGAGVSRGYLDRPALNAERFIAFEGQRFYRTGDKVRRTSDGEYWYLGRLDDQVNLHGYRIELGEIEAAIRQHDKVQDAYVTLDSQQQQIVAWLTINADLSRGELVASLEDKLPLYMRPSHYRQVESFPLTGNGKIDRKALDQIHYLSLSSHTTYVAPRTPLETQLAAAWEALFARQVGVYDDYFALGGDSIRSIKLANMLSEQGVQFSAHHVFLHPTIAALAESISQANEQQTAATVAQPRARFPLTASQQGMFFHCLSSDRKDMYVEQLSFAVQQRLNADLFKLAWQLAVEQFPALRTRFITTDTHDVVQEVLTAAQTHWQWQQHSAAANNQGDWAAWIDEQQTQAAQQGFDVAESGLFSVRLLESERSQQVIWTWHHLILDGWSLTLVLEQVFENYRHLLNAQAPESLQAEALFDHQNAAYAFADYVDFQANTSTDSEFWRSMFAGYQPQAPLGIMRSCNAEKLGTEVSEARLSSAAFQQLQAFAQQQAVPVNSVITAMWQLVASVYHQTQTPVIGVTLSGRSAPIANIQQAVGVLINTLPLRQSIADAQSVHALLQDTFTQFRGVLAHEHDSLSEIQQLLKAELAMQEAPLTELFDTLLVFENYLPAQNSADKTASSYIVNAQLMAEFGVSDVALKEDTNYPMTVTLFPSDELLIRVMSDASCIDRRFVEPMLSLFTRLLEQLPKAFQDQASVSVEHLLAACLPSYYADGVSAQSIDLESHWRLEQGIAQQAQQQPTAIAVQCDKQVLTYSELEERSNQLANYLIQQGVTIGDRIGLYFPRQQELVIAMLAVLKSGAAYVPLDLDYPEERIAFIAEDANCHTILGLSTSPCPFAQSNQRLCYLDAESSAISACSTQLSPEHLASLRADHAAYFIYTSGSTGQPKGVKITHSNVQSLVEWTEATYSQTQLSCVLASTSICFDLSVFEIFVPLVLGGSVYLVNNALQLIYEAQPPAVSLINSVPSITRELVQQQAIPESVSVVNLAGEPLPRSLVNQLYDLPQVQAVFNLYGPSEDTTYSTFEQVPNETQAPVYIGRPLPGTIAWVVNSAKDSANQIDWPVPFGCEGELVLSGVSVAAGYLNRDDQTKERFISVAQLLAEPWHSQVSAPCLAQSAYRTGDRVRWSADGKLEYLGRQDHQVKFRGVRIELQEIQLVAERYPQVDSCVVLVTKDDKEQPHLVAYVTGDALDPEGFDQKAFLQALRAHLPVSMVPTAVFALASFPLTPNKKIDIRQLPIPNAALHTDGASDAESAENTEVFAANSAVAKTLYQLWCDILGKAEIPANGDFFALGGHSLMATKLMVAVQAEWGLSLRLSQILQMPTLAEQVAYVESHVAPEQEQDALLNDDELDMSDQDLLDELAALSEDELDVLLNLADE